MPSAALAAEEEHCPAARGAAAAVDWGTNASEQIGAGFGSNYENAPQPVLALSGVTHVKAGFKFGLALLGNCTLKAWGNANKGQLGDGSQQPENHPVALPGLSEVKEIAVANAHAMALRYNGTVWTWGASEFGERGNKEKGFERTARQTEPWFVPRDKPNQVPGLSGVVQIAAGGTRDYALLANGQVMAWGEDHNGQLGVEEGSSEEEQCFGETHQITPVQCSTIPRTVKVAGLGALSGVERIGAGEETAYAVRRGGAEVLAWGAGSKGQLGNGSTRDSPSPVRASFQPGSPVLEIVGGSTHVLARLANGEVYAWGGDGAGQLGFEASGEASETCGHDKECANVPTPVIALNHVVALAAGEGISLALKEEEGGRKVIYSFGATGFYELLGLGNVSFTSTSTPTPITGLGSVQGISISTTSALALLESESARTPALALGAKEAALGATWSTPTEKYKLRDRPVGTRNFSKTQEGSCKSPCQLGLTGLEPEPYEVLLKSPEGREGREKTRKAIALPLPGSGVPVNLSPPTVSGSPATETGKLRQGQTLTIAHGSWSNSPTGYVYEWLRCLGNGEAGAAEELGSECEQAGSGETYVVQAQDVAQTLIAKVEAKNGAGWSSAVSAAEVILASGEESEPPYPTPTSPPTISGSAVVGRPLLANHGSWENSPTGYEDKWLHCKARGREGTGAGCAPIVVKNGKGENEQVVSEEFTPGEAQIGEWIEVQERAENPGGWELSFSRAVQIAPNAPPVNETPPTIAGTFEQGQVLSAQEGTWKNAPNRAFWQWLRCNPGGGGCTPIGGATQQTYTIAPEDVAHRIELAESVENGVGRSEAADSTESEIVPTPPPQPPEAHEPPTVTGTVEQGRTLTAHGSSWSEEPKSFAYQWKRCEASGNNCRAISGANTAGYTLTGADVGKTIVFKETATNATGSGVSNSVASATVAGAVPVSSAPPTIRGNAQQGAPLGEYHGGWSNEPGSFAYQWQKCNASGGSCEAISGATSRTYVPATADVGATLRVEEVASNATGAGAGAMSIATLQIAPAAPVNVAPPSVSGSPEEGQKLIAHPGSWSNSPTGHLYQWMRCETLECRPIESATGAEYELTGADVGYSVGVREAASNAGGWEAAVSETLAVGGTPVPVVSALSPATGPAEGGTTVTISGANFQEASEVDFGFTNAEYEVLSPGKIRASAPAGASGSVAVTVTTPHGTSDIDAGSHFTYGPPPKASGIEPKEGSTEGGTVVTISGSNFSEATAVKFGGSDAQSYGVHSSGSIVAVAPAGTGTVGVTVATPYGTTSAGSGEQFTYVRTGSAPVVKKLSQRKGPAAGGTKLTITGTAFTEASAVEFGHTAATSFTVLSATSISAEAPPSASGTVDVTVTNPFGTSALGSGDHFKFEKPIVSAVRPAEGALAGGTIVIVSGSGFAVGESSAFTFGKASATSVECPSTTECTMIAPPLASSHGGTVEVKADVNGKKSSATDPGDHYTYH